MPNNTGFKNTKLLIKEMRLKRGLSQSRLGEALGLSQAQVGKIENGDSVNGSRLEDIANFFGCSVSDLFYGAEKQEDFVPDKSLSQDIHDAISYVLKNKKLSISKESYADAFSFIYNEISNSSKNKIEALQESNIANVIKLVREG